MRNDDIRVEVNDESKTAILIVDGWETLIDYDKSHKITKDSDVVKMLKRISKLSEEATL